MSLLNKIYQDHNIWLTYGQFQWSNTEKKGFCEPYDSTTIVNNTFRDAVWQSSQLRTFYAKLFKLIKKKDLIHNGRFIPIAGDLASFYPMLEMAQERHKCLTEVVYIYNVSNPLNDFKIDPRKQLRIDHIVRNKRRYFRIPSLWD